MLCFGTCCKSQKSTLRDDLAVRIVYVRIKTGEMGLVVLALRESDEKRTQTKVAHDVRYDSTEEQTKDGL